MTDAFAAHAAEKPADRKDRLREGLAELQAQGLEVDVPRALLNQVMRFFDDREHIGGVEGVGMTTWHERMRIGKLSNAAGGRPEQAVEGA